MTLKQTMAELEKAGTEQNRKVYSRHGVKSRMFGVSYANLRRIAKTIKTDQKLALSLWTTGNHDARVLATMIADPWEIEEKTLREWARQLDNYVLTDALSALVSKTPHATKLMETWTKAKGEWTGQAGWNLVTYLAMSDRVRSDEDFVSLLHTIEKKISKSRNRVRHAMNGSIIAIGMRNRNLEIAATDTAKKIGRVDVDHGETGCVTPDAVDYIKKAKPRKKR